MTADLDQQIMKAAERVLSAWFYDVRFKAAWKPDPSLFLLPAHRAMAEVMAARGPSLEEGGLTLELRRLGKLSLFQGLGAGSDVQGANEIAQIVHGTAGVLDPWAAVGELRALVATRALRAGLVAAVRGIDGGWGLPEARTAVAGSLQAASAVGTLEAANLRPALASEVKRILGPARAMGCSTGSLQLDLATGGLCPRDVWVIGAPTSWGKSSYLCALFRLALAAGLRLLIVSGEDPIGLYAQRILTGLADVNATRARNAMLDPAERARLANVLAGVPDFPFFLDAIGRPAEAVAADIRSTIACSDAPGEQWIVCVDYIQAFRAQQQQQDKRNDIIACSRLFTNAIKQSGAAGVQFSQVTTVNGVARMREAEDLINMAEVGLYGEIEEEAVKMDRDGRKLEAVKVRSFRVSKVKNGAAGYTVPLAWDDNAACFAPNKQPDADYFDRFDS
jgi:hypothetical protein